MNGLGPDVVLVSICRQCLFCYFVRIFKRFRHNPIVFVCNSTSHFSSHIIVPGNVSSIARQFLRCTFYNLAPNGLFVQLFQTPIPGEHAPKAVTNRPISVFVILHEMKWNSSQTSWPTVVSKSRSTARDYYCDGFVRGPRGRRMCLWDDLRISETGFPWLTLRTNRMTISWVVVGFRPRQPVVNYLDRMVFDYGFILTR